MVLYDWDLKGYYVVCVGINFLGDELYNLMFVECIGWELEWYEILVWWIGIEVLEFVIVGIFNGVVVCNL